MRIAKQLTNFLKSVRKPNQIFVDGMVGGGSILRFMDGQRIANDLCPYLISFYNGLVKGWTPPQSLSEEKYKELQQLYRNGVCNADIAFGLYFNSFGGKFNGGFARDRKTDRDFSKEAYLDSLKLCNGQYRDAVKISEGIKNVTFYNLDYENLLNTLPNNCLVYFDIPYKNTTQYRFKFDHERFYKVVRELSGSHDIYISEYTMPDDFECVWEINRKTNLNMSDGGKANRIEKIFKHRRIEC